MGVKTRITKFRQTAMQRGGKSLVLIGVYLVVAIVSFYGDGVFVWMNIGHYTGQLAVVFQIFLILGAFCTSASIMLLLAGKAIWFSPGKQLILAYIFTGVEVLVNVLNIIVALNENLGIVDLWRVFSPATPFVALIGWVIVLSVDTEQQERHEQREFEEESARIERQHAREQHLDKLDHEQALFDAQMELSDTYLQYEKKFLGSIVASPEMQAQLKDGAFKLAADTFSSLTGLPFIPSVSPTYQQSPPQLPAPQSSTFQCGGCGLIGDGAGWRYIGMKLGRQYWYCLACDARFNADGTPKQPGPLAQPHLTPQANQAGTNGNGQNGGH